MNQGKLEVVKQGIARVNIDILGISELRWTGMGEFNSDDHYIYYLIVPWLQEQGYQLVTVSQLLKAKTGELPEPGTQYVTATKTMN